MDTDTRDELVIEEVHALLRELDEHSTLVRLSTEPDNRRFVARMHELAAKFNTVATSLAVRASQLADILAEALRGEVWDV